MDRITVAQFLLTDAETQNDAWYDWFCRDKSLPGKTKLLVPKVKRIAKSSKIDVNKMYVWFKNNCPCYGDYRLYDDLRFADIETQDTIYTVTPRNPHGKAEVWGRENDFDGPLVEGTWKDVLAFFGV